MKIELSGEAEKQLGKLHLNGKLFERIVTALKELGINPFAGKPLEGQFEGTRSYRVGDWRIIYEVNDEILVVYVIRIAHRREAYR